MIHKIMIKGKSVYVRNEYGSYTKNGDTDMEAQKNACSYKELKRAGFIPK